MAALGRPGSSNGGWSSASNLVRRLSNNNASVNGSPPSQSQSETTNSSSARLGSPPVMDPLSQVGGMESLISADELALTAAEAYHEADQCAAEPVSLQPTHDR
jgi:hypothetical protein